MSDSLWPHGLYSSWNSPGKNTGVGSLSLLQGIFPTQGSNVGLLHCRQILYQLSHKGSPRILEWAAYPFSSGSSWPRNWTTVSCIAGRFFNNSAIREALNLSCNIKAGGMAEHRPPTGPNTALEPGSMNEHVIHSYLYIYSQFYFQHYWLGHRLGLLCYWMVCHGNEQRSFCRFSDCIQVLHFRLFCWLWCLLHFF